MNIKLTLIVTVLRVKSIPVSDTSSTNQHFRVYIYGTNINIICIKTQHTKHLLNKPTGIQPPYLFTGDHSFILCPFKGQMTKEMQSV